MGTKQDVFVNDHDRCSFCAIQFCPQILLDVVLFPKHIFIFRNSLKRLFASKYESIFGIVIDNVIFIGFFDFDIKVFRILLEEEDICFDLFEVTHNFFTFFLLIQETQFIEGSQFLDVIINLLICCLFQLVYAVDISQETMKHRDIILLHHLFLLLFIGHFHFGDILFELFFPLLLELLPSDKLVIFYSGFQDKHGRVPSSILYIEFSKLKNRFCFPVLEVQREDINKLTTYVLELLEIIFAVELKRTVHDSTVVEGCDNNLSESLLFISDWLFAIAIDTPHFKRYIFRRKMAPLNVVGKKKSYLLHLKLDSFSLMIFQ